MALTIGVPRETFPGERRVALVPRTCEALGKLGVGVIVEQSAGAEAGFPDFKAAQWIGLLATGGTPKPIVDRLNKDIQRALQLRDVQASLERQGMTIVGGPASDFGSLIEAEIAQWTDVARKANIQME